MFSLGCVELFDQTEASHPLLTSQVFLVPSGKAPVPSKASHTASPPEVPGGSAVRYKLDSVG
jgi:hypothetical protein